MSRIIKSDFEELTSFVKNYTLTNVMCEQDFLEFLSSIHKKFYSYLVLIEEYRLLIDQDKNVPIIGETQFEYLQESMSDCGQCLFLAINGCYRGAHLLLRSSIENFLKGISLDEVPQIIKEKNVYQVFDDAETVDVFSKTKFNIELHNIYSELCMDAHTIDINHMAGVSALRFFPNFDKKAAKRFASLYVRLLPIFVTALCLKYNTHFHSINYLNKEVITASIISGFKASVYGE